MTEHVPERLMRHIDVPFCSLGLSTKYLLARHLDPKKNGISPTTLRLQDWRGLAEEFGFDQIDVENLDRKDNPTVDVLSAWLQLHPDATIGHFLQALLQIERYDVLREPTLHAAVGK